MNTVNCSETNGNLDGQGVSAGQNTGPATALTGLNGARPVILVTGGCQGLGLEICQQMSGLAWRVAIADINESAGPEAIASLEHQGGEALFVAVDLASENGAQSILREILARFGRLDVLVNSAAHAAVGSFLDIEGGA